MYGHTLTGDELQTLLESLQSSEAVVLRRCPILLARLGVRWPRATHWIIRPDPDYVRQKNGATGSWPWLPASCRWLWAGAMRCGPG